MLGTRCLFWLTSGLHDLTADQGEILTQIVRGIPELLLSFLTIGAGAYVVFITIRSAIRTFVLPRSAPDLITRFWFRHMRRLFEVLLIKRARTFEEIDARLALYAPVTLVALPFLWLSLIMFGYSLIFWGLDLHPSAMTHMSWQSLEFAIRLSGSSMLTLGFIGVDGLLYSLLAFSEAALGPVMIALLIAYLPTLYSAFSKREELVTMLEVRAGSPPTPTEMFRRIIRYAGQDELNLLWKNWEVWFSELEESHSSLPMLAFFRSQQPSRSWITASGLVLDAAALQLSTLDLRDNGYAALCLRAGFLALQRISGFFGIKYNPDPKPTDPISITREEYDEVYDELAALNMFPLKKDRDQAWRDFAGWRVNYDAPLIALAQLVSAPYARWSSDRGIRMQRPRLFAPHNNPDQTAQLKEEAERQVREFEASTLGYLNDATPTPVAEPLPIDGDLASEIANAYLVSDAAAPAGPDASDDGLSGIRHPETGPGR